MKEKPFSERRFSRKIRSVSERYKIIDECLTELSKYAYTSFAFSVLRKLQEK